MPPVPALALSSPHGLGVTTPRSAASRSARPSTTPSYNWESATFSRSARHIVTPQVGLSAMVSALGNLKAPWEVSATQKFTPRMSTDAAASERPFSVGRSRAQHMLNMALSTQDDQAKVRRLEQALEMPCVRYERAATPRLMQVARDAQSAQRELTKKERRAQRDAALAKPKAAPAAPSVQDEDVGDEEKAALRIQSLYRGGKDREAVKKMKDEETQAAPSSDQGLGVMLIVPATGFDLQTRAPGAQFAVSEAFSGPSGQRPWRADLLYRRLGADRFLQLLDEAEVLTKKFQDRIRKARGFFHTANGIIWHVTPDGEVRGLHENGSKIRDRVQVTPDDKLQIGPFCLDETRTCSCIHWLRKDDPTKSWNWSRDNSLRTRVRLATGEKA
ncbi:unnamed protein product [Effrenium voratum]|uniref:Uncharacterized protein n=1 Tax=Effrenium voratum TaxID=2562239 RepID=A0AA36N902_9DINO|nr:unnamed protein product [Effrenium voratum]